MMLCHHPFCLVPNFFFLGSAHGMWKFLGQEKNTCHTVTTARSLTSRPPGNS